MRMRVKFQLYDFVPARNEIIFWYFEWTFELKNLAISLPRRHLQIFEFG